MLNGDKYVETKEKAQSYIKSKAFDLVSICIIVAMTVLSLGIVELRDVTWKEIGNILVENIPFYVAATFLSVTYYTKGAFSGKLSEAFKNAQKYYSELASNLTGAELKLLPQFCDEYNNKTRSEMQRTLLHSVAITFEEFDEGTKEIAPLKTFSKKDLIDKYGKDVAKVILKCKKIEVKGIYPNVLLGNLHSNDNTDLGNNESELKAKRTGKYILMYAFSVFSLSLIAVKDVVEWGWYGALITLFKVLYIAAVAYFKFYDGYEDLTVNVPNHLCRKSDLLKEFKHYLSSVVTNDDHSDSNKSN